MAGRIPQHFIDELLARVDLIELINARVPLTKQGSEFKACCPFHAEKTPSFAVNPNKQVYHCFGCGASGGAIRFLMEYDNLPFVETVELLAKQAGMEIPRDHDEPNDRSKRLAPLLSLQQRCLDWYHQQLQRAPSNHPVHSYLQRRGVSPEMIELYQLGYAPAGWSQLLQAMGEEATTNHYLTQIGMVVEKEGGGHYDRFRNRLIFPILDSRGRAIGLGGRVLDEAKPKYLNSPETPLFHKSEQLYGLYQARQHHRKLQQIVVVEGYMDVVALAQFGIRYAVATLGTATTSSHLRTLFRSVERIIFCFDGDTAGTQAAAKAMETALPLMRDGREVRFLFLPDGEDPDTLIRREGREPFEQRIEQSIPLSEQFFNQLLQQGDCQSIDGRARLMKLAQPMLAKLPSGLFREMMFDQLSSTLKVTSQQVRDHLHPSTQPQPRPAPSPPPPQRPTIRNTTPPVTSPSPVRTALHALLHNPRLAERLPETSTLLQAKRPGLQLLMEVIDTLQHNPEITTAALLERWRGHQDEETLYKVARWQPQVPEDSVEREFDGAMAQLLRFAREQQIEQLLERSRTTPLTPKEQQQLQQLLVAK